MIIQYRNHGYHSINVIHCKGLQDDSMAAIGKKNKTQHGNIPLLQPHNKFSRSPCLFATTMLITFDNIRCQVKKTCNKALFDG